MPISLRLKNLNNINAINTIIKDFSDVTIQMIVIMQQNINSDEMFIHKFIQYYLEGYLQILFSLYITITRSLNINHFAFNGNQYVIRT